MSDADLQWVVNAYALMFGGFLLLGGRAGDLIGRKRVFLAGVVIFTGRLAPERARATLGVLILSRGPPGLGAALVSPAALSIITTTFAEGAERTKAMGVWAAIAVGGGAVGLLARRRPRRGLLVAVDLLRQRPGRDRGLRRSLRYRAGVEGRARAQELRRRRRGHRHGGPDRARLRDRQGAGEGLGLGRTRSASSRSPLSLLGAFVLIEQPLGGAARPSQRSSACGRCAARTSSMFFVAAGLFAMFYFNTLYVQRVLGLLAARGGPRVPPVHRRDHHRRRALADARPEARRARGADHRDADRRRPGCCSSCGSTPGGTTSPTSCPGSCSLDRDGAHVRAGHADRDERHPGRRRGARIRALQHVAAGRRRARARDPLDARASTRPTTRSLDERRPTATSTERSSTASTSPTSAARVPLSPGAVLLALMLKRSDVERIDVDDGATVPA